MRQVFGGQTARRLLPRAYTKSTLSRVRWDYGLPESTSFALFSLVVLHHWARAFAGIIVADVGKG